MRANAQQDDYENDEFEANYDDSHSKDVREVSHSILTPLVACEYQKPKSSEEPWSIVKTGGQLTCELIGIATAEDSGP
jgi:hypothetical protein